MICSGEQQAWEAGEEGDICDRCHLETGRSELREHDGQCADCSAE